MSYGHAIGRKRKRLRILKIFLFFHIRLNKLRIDINQIKNKIDAFEPIITLCHKPNYQTEFIVLHYLHVSIEGWPKCPLFYKSQIAVVQ